MIEKKEGIELPKKTVPSTNLPGKNIEDIIDVAEIKAASTKNEQQASATTKSTTPGVSVRDNKQKNKVFGTDTPKVALLIIGILAFIVVLMLLPDKIFQSNLPALAPLANSSEKAATQAYEPSEDDLLGLNLLEYEGNYGKTATLQLTDFTVQPDGSYVGKTVTKYLLTLNRISEVARNETAKKMKVFMTVENLGESIGTDSTLLIVDQYDRISASDCSYLTQPKTKKEMICLFKGLDLETVIKSIAVKRQMGPGREAIEKLFELEYKQPPKEQPEKKPLIKKP